MSTNNKINNDVGADYSSGVKIEKVFGGYFSDQKNIDDFIRIGIKPILEKLKNKNKITVADFGGGAGNLAEGVKSFLKQHFETADMVVIDANPDYLNKAQEKNLDTIEANLLEYYDIEKYDLIIQRAVLHYNEDTQKQKKLLENIKKSLKQDGFFISQLSTGSKENCNMRNEIVNQVGLLPAGGRRTHLWVSPEEYTDLLSQVGFQNNKIAGFAKSGSWTITEMWNRFNKNIESEVFSKNDMDEISRYNERKKAFFSNSVKIINKYLDASDKETLMIEQKGKDFTISYQYPIFVSSN